MTSLRTRVARLEKEAPPDDGTGVLALLLAAPADLSPADRERLGQLRTAVEAEQARRVEGSVAARLYRRHLARLGLTQPADLRGVDVVEEVIRLVGVPTPAAAGEPPA